MSAAATQNPPQQQPFPSAPSAMDQNAQQQQQQQPQTTNSTNANLFSAGNPEQQDPNAAQNSDAAKVTATAALISQLRAGVPPAPPMRQTRKRKSPATTEGQQHGPTAPPQPQPTQVQAAPQQQSTPQPPPAQPGGPPQMHPGLAPPPGNVYQPPIQYYAPPQEYAAAAAAAAAALMQQHGAQQLQQQQQQQEPQTPDQQRPSRQLSTSKRAEQNRKAQRAFRERRDQHVKALESRSQLLDAALASADEANRRWEECRALVDQLRIENTALRSALQQAQAQLAAAGQTPTGAAAAGTNAEGGAKTDNASQDTAGQEAPNESTAAS